ncbi:MAG TPA: helix-turn-helix transcriptional regulator [Burkholderiaceae bacterium]|nr:helix-turn-helix transcriptional regulator [Burkholderiaceae bacterium]
MSANLAAMRPVGELLRDWRQRRRLSQLELAELADVSPRHVSFVETGRSVPSRELLIRIATRLDVPLRERNALMIAAGYAPIYPQRPLSDRALAMARDAVRLVLNGHEPYPALAVDRHWTMVDANAPVARLVSDADPQLLAPPVNVLRLSLHPRGLAPRIANLAQWRAHLLERLQAQIAATGDATLIGLLRELRDYPAPALRPGELPAQAGAIVVPLQLDTGAGVLSMISTTTVFGSPVDVTLSELAIEAFFPSDAASAELLRSLAGS